MLGRPGHTVGFRKNSRQRTPGTRYQEFLLSSAARSELPVTRSLLPRRSERPRQRLLPVCDRGRSTRVPVPGSHGSNGCTRGTKRWGITAVTISSAI
eukprot:682940-Rhodomonas_salina.1